MNDIKLLIDSFNEGEVSGFLAFAKARNKRSLTHNLSLFKLLKSGKTRDLDLAIYGRFNPNALYALKNRLQSNLIEFIAIQGFKNDQKEEMSILKWLLAGRILLEKGHYKMGRRLLEKCEVHAAQSELYSLLNEIFLTLLEYAHHHDKVNFNDLQKRFKHNLSALKTSNTIALLFANYKNVPEQLPMNKVDYINSYLSEYLIFINDKLSFKNMFHLLEIVTDAATSAGNYYRITAFVDEIYQVTQDKKKLIPKNLWYYLECLFLIALTHFRTRDFIRSQQVLNEITVHLKTQNNSYQSHFHERVQLLQSLCLHFSGNRIAALEVLSTFKKPSFEAILIKTVYTFQNGNPSAALKVLNKLNKTDAYYEKSHAPALLLKKNLLEVLLFIDLNKWDLADSRLVSLRKKQKQIPAVTDRRTLIFIKILVDYCSDPELTNQIRFKKPLDQLSINEYEEDVFAICFYAWIKSKFNREHWYDTTLELIAR